MTTTADGTTGLSYVLTINRAASDNALLADLFLANTQGFLTLSPDFAATTTDYTATVSNDTELLTVNPRAEDPQATATVNGASVESGDSGASIPLNVGAISSQ